MATQPAPQAPQQAAMEDILSSIRTGVEEEGSKVGTGSADLIDAAATDDDDVLELSPTDMVAAPATGGESEELIDIAAFATSGQEKPADPASMADLAADILGEAGKPAPATAPEPTAAEVSAADDFDRLLAEISQEQTQNVAAAEVSKQALMEEEEPLGAESAAEDDVSEAPVAAVASAPVTTNGKHVASVASGYTLSTVEGTGGMQVAFPAEVLAMALRPMVQDWLAQNLPGIVEALVKEEISKLTQG